MESLSPATAPARAGTRSVRLTRLSDELLARYAARGSDRAFTVLYERYHQPLYRYCRSIVRDDADAQDALQSTFAGALSALRRGQRSAPPRPWLFRIAHNESISLLRRRRRRLTEQELPRFGPEAAASAEQEAADRARWSLLVDDLAELPERLRGALLLRELNGLSHEEIGIALGTTAGGAKQAIFEARQALSELSEGRAMRCEEIRRRISAGDRRVLRGRAVRAHLRDCAACAEFAGAIRERRTELRAYAPALAPAAAAALLNRSIRAASGHGGGAVGGSAAAGASAASSPVAASSAAATGAAGKVAVLTVVSKALAGVAVVATAGAGVIGLERLVSRPDSPTAATARNALARAAGSHHHDAAGSVRAAGSEALTGGVSATGAGHADRARRSSKAPGHAVATARPGAHSGSRAGSGHGTASPGASASRRGAAAPRRSATSHGPATSSATGGRTGLHSSATKLGAGGGARAKPTSSGGGSSSSTRAHRSLSGSGGAGRRAINEARSLASSTAPARVKAVVP